ncbi:hypothetical protein O4H66_13535 [Comamonadaceae bacterium G21597-S1]|nr:hypothetical protein [Comamonadaceae bacterium G21597-S1]
MQAEIDKACAASACETDDGCALALVRRLSATLDVDPARWRDGDALPRGWHVIFFTADTRHAALRPDGVAGFGVALPDLGLPRVVFGGRRASFHGDIPIGARMRRVSRLLSVLPKQGRSGRFAVATVQHEIHVGDRATPVVVEQQDYVMREAAEAGAEGGRVAGAAKPAAPSETGAKALAGWSRTVVPDEMLLFRVSALMFNTHRIHYDHPYATRQEGYPALVANASVSSLLLLEYFRAQTGHEPASVRLRNIGLAYCGQPLHLHVVPSDGGWNIWTENGDGARLLEGRVD